MPSDGEQGDDEAFLDDELEVEEEGSGEEQHGEHAVQDEVFEVDLLDEVDGQGVEAGGGGADGFEEQGEDDGEEDGADSERELEPAGADPAEDGGDGDEGPEDVEGCHGGRGKTRTTSLTGY